MEREGILKQIPTELGTWHEAWSEDSEIMTWAEIKSQMSNQLSHPDATPNLYLISKKPLLIYEHIFFFNITAFLGIVFPLGHSEDISF